MLLYTVYTCLKSPLLKGYDIFDRGINVINPKSSSYAKVNPQTWPKFFLKKRKGLLHKYIQFSRSLSHLQHILLLHHFLWVLLNIKFKCVLWVFKEDDSVVAQVDVRDWWTGRPSLLVSRAEGCDTKQYSGAPMLSSEVIAVTVCCNKFLVMVFGTQQCLPEACARLCAEKGVPEPGDT